MRLIDTHAHLYLEQFNDDIDLVIKTAMSNGVYKIYLPNIDSAYTMSLHKLEKSYPDICFAMMGLHPCSVKQNYKDELNKVKEAFELREYIAVGEIGIDLYWDKTFFKEQMKAFEYQISLAKDLNVPFVIHSRDSLDETIATVSRLQDGNLRGIFHCFGGTELQAKQIVDLGFYLGIGGVLTFKNSGLSEQLVNLDLDSMVLETDAPYLSPVPYRGKRNESSYLLNIAQKLAEVKKCSLEEVAEVTTMNANKIFSNTPSELKKPS